MCKQFRPRLLYVRDGCDLKREVGVGGWGVCVKVIFDRLERHEFFSSPLSRRRCVEIIAKEGRSLKELYLVSCKITDHGRTLSLSLPNPPQGPPPPPPLQSQSHINVLHAIILCSWNQGRTVLFVLFGAAVKAPTTLAPESPE